MRQEGKDEDKPAEKDVKTSSFSTALPCSTDVVIRPDDAEGAVLRDREVEECSEHHAAAEVLVQALRDEIHKRVFLEVEVPTPLARIRPVCTRTH